MKTLLCIVGPRGVGKTTLARTLTQNNIEQIVTTTTRSKREGCDDYHFVSTEEFQKLIAEHELLEYNNYHGRYYGVSYASVYKALLMENSVPKRACVVVDVNGALTLNDICGALGITVITLFLTADKRVILERLLARVNLTVSNEDAVNTLASYIANLDDELSWYEQLTEKFKQRKLKHNLYLLQSKDISEIVQETMNICQEVENAN